MRVGLVRQVLGRRGAQRRRVAAGRLQAEHRPRCEVGVGPAARLGEAAVGLLLGDDVVSRRRSRSQGECDSGNRKPHAQTTSVRSRRA